uniref:Polysaccharide biosynthesis protein n=1 Tax=Caenorhabditis tropicalis TaxID=1561998 RepID=A0A1I7V268_9PELO
MSMHSKNTLQMQKKFLQAVYVQSGVLLLSLQVPVSYFVFAIYSDTYIQTANNLSFVFMSLHGIACTVVMILVHKPYRKFCFSWFGAK